MEGRPGWEQLIRTAAETASWQRAIEWPRSLDAGGGLVLTPLDLQGLDLERVRGTVAAARALSREICEVCGGPGDAVWPAGGRGGTRCSGCRGAGDEVLPRDDAWRRERDPERERPDRNAPWDSYRRYSVLEDRYAFGAVMDAGYHPDDERAWFGDGVRGGWSHLLRAAFTLLVPEQVGPRPGRLSEIKEKWVGCASRGPTAPASTMPCSTRRTAERPCVLHVRPPRRDARRGLGPSGLRPLRGALPRRHDRRRPFGQVRRLLANRRRFQGLASEEERRERRAWMAADRRALRRRAR